MKKFVTTALVCGMLLGGFSLSAAGDVSTGNRIAEKLALYLPNIVLDAFDLFSVSVGVGPVVEAQLMASRACSGGVGIGMSYKMCKNHHRQIGFAQEEGFYWSLISIGQEHYGVVESTPLVMKYNEVRQGFPKPGDRVYDPYVGQRDYWQIGGSLGLGLCGDLYIHPLEWLDLLTGVFGYDLMEDDITFDTFRK